MKYIKNFFFLLFFTTSVLSYQNCGDVSLSPPVIDEMASVDPALGGEFCFPYPIELFSKYTLANLYVVNVNVARFNGGYIIDYNANGVFDDFESEVSPDTLSITSFDSDGDGVLDFIEKLKGTNPNRSDMVEDGIDLDGRINIDEIKAGTDPYYADSNLEIIYSVNTKKEDTCADGQPVYAFDIQRIPLLNTSDFIDTINTGIANFSHAADENVVLVLAQMQPDDSRQEVKYLLNVVKLPVGATRSQFIDRNNFFLMD